MIKYQNLFLQQSYIDSYDDYIRTINGSNVPHWDFCIITASNEAQAEGYRDQINYRLEHNLLCPHTHYAVIPDPEGKRVGSGGATLGVMKYVREQTGLDSFRGLKILVIHSGGDSKRVPQYSACGKLFSPVPRELPQGRRSTLFDETIIGTSGIPSRISDGMLICSGDVLLLYNPLQIDFYSKGAAAISIKEDVETGKNHGVFLRDDEGNVGKFLHKQSVESLKAAGAVNAQNKVNIDTGAVIFESHLLDDLYSLVDTDEKFSRYVNEQVRLSFYADFLYPLASDSTLEEFYRETPEGEFSDQLTRCRYEIWQAISKYSMKLMCFSPASFIHFGTTGELLKLLTKEIEHYGFLGWTNCVYSNKDTKNYAITNSFIHPSARIGEGSYIEDSYIRENTHIGSGCVISGITLKNITIPDGTVLHGLKLRDGRFCVRMYATTDNPKENRWFGAPLDMPLWSKPLFPVCDSIEEAVAATLSRRTDCELQSLCDSFNNADVREILPWRLKLGDVVMVEKYIGCIDRLVPFEEANKIFLNGVSERVKNLLVERAEESDFSRKIRIYYYLSKLCRGTEAEGYMAKCFSTIREIIIEQNENAIFYNPNRKIQKDEVVSKLPVRVNWGGGWTDTPPHCNEHGGTVLNAALLLDDGFPIEVVLRRLEEPKIVLTSADYGSYREFYDIAELQDCNSPHDPYALSKAALIATGIIPRDGEETLEEILHRLGGGIYFSTQVINIPRGSGLGTSSILAAACVKGIYEMLGEEVSESEICSRVLQMEQIMSTGGGWQDQMGGLLGGVKILTSKVGITQNVEWEPLELSDDTIAELNERFCLIYTGQRRLARNLLREVMGRYIGANPESLEVLRSIQNMAWQMKRELENGNVDAFARSLSQHWELSKRLDGGCTNTCIDQIFLACEDMIDGKMICGAGGGGFLQVILKKGITHEDLRERLSNVFADSGVDVWNCSLYM